MPGQDDEEIPQSMLDVLQRGYELFNPDPTSPLREMADALSAEDAERTEVLRIANQMANNLAKYDASKMPPGRIVVLDKESNFITTVVKLVRNELRKELRDDLQALYDERESGTLSPMDHDRGYSNGYQNAMRYVISRLKDEE